MGMQNRNTCVDRLPFGDDISLITDTPETAKIQIGNLIAEAGKIVLQTSFLKKVFTKSAKDYARQLLIETKSRKSAYLKII